MKILQQIFQYINVHGEKVRNHHENKHFLKNQNEVFFPNENVALEKY